MSKGTVLLLCDESIYGFRCFRVLFLSFVLIVWSISILPFRAEAEGILPGETAAQPKDRSTTVTATVPDIIAPTAPILVSPPNGSQHTQTPSFVWRASSDAVGVTGYDFYLNGELKQGNLSTLSESTTTYSLIFNSESNSYTLTFADSVPDGTHTWQVVAKDDANNQAGSETWVFSLDTRAPTFTIHTIDTSAVSISSSNPASVPTTAIVLTNNQPLLQGLGEALSTFSVTVRRQDNSLVDQLTGSVNGAGSWSLYLHTLPRDIILELDFVITDAFGLTSTLSDVPIILPTPTITIPTPGGDDIVVDVIPPIELVETTVREMQLLFYSEFIFPIQPILEPLDEITSEATIIFTTVATEHTKVLSPVWYTHLMALLALLLLPLLKTLIISFPLFRHLSPKMIEEILRFVGIFPDRRRRAGICVLQESLQPLAGAIISYIDPEEMRTYAQVITDNSGYIPYPDIHTSVLRVAIHGKSILLLSRPESIKPLDWYEGEMIIWEKALREGGIVLPIPTDVRMRLRDRILRKNKYPFVAICLAVLCAVVTPTLGNIFVSSIAVVAWGIHRLKKSHKQLLISVFYRSLTKVDKAIIRINHSTSPGLYHVSSAGEVWLASATGLIVAQAFDHRRDYSAPAECRIRESHSEAEIDLIIEN